MWQQLCVIFMNVIQDCLLLETWSKNIYSWNNELHNKILICWEKEVSALDCFASSIYPLNELPVSQLLFPMRIWSDNFSKNVSEIPGLHEANSVFLSSPSSLEKNQSLRNEPLKRMHKQTLLTWLCAVRCGADFIYRKCKTNHYSVGFLQLSVMMSYPIPLTPLPFSLSSFVYLFFFLQITCVTLTIRNDLDGKVLMKFSLTQETKYCTTLNRMLHELCGIAHDVRTAMCMNGHKQGVEL